MELLESTFDYHGLPVRSFCVGKGKPLIVLHGWGSSAEVMKPISTSLKLKRCLHIIDLPGFGQTPPPPEAWSIDDYADMIQAYINQLERPVDVLAHSFGGRITLKLCAREGSSALVDKVLITGGAGMKPKRPVMYYIRKYTAKSLKYPFTLLPEPLMNRGLNWLRDTALWKMLGSSDYKTLNGVMREVFVKTVSEYLEHTLPNIQQEVLLLWGKNDDATPIYQAKRMEKGLINGGLAIIEGAGHYAFLDRPHQFKIITETFFK